MVITNKKKYKYVAFGYFVYFLMYLSIIAILVDAIGWREVATTIRDNSAIAKTLLIFSGLLLLNFVLAFDTWRVQTLSPIRRKVLMAGAIIMALAALIDTILTWWSWLQELTPSDLGVASVVGRSLSGIGYVLLAYLLVNVVTSISKNPQLDLGS